jgi:hypothetical protein
MIVICYNKFINKHCYTCKQPEEDLKPIQKPKFYFQLSPFLPAICFERDFKWALNIWQNFLFVLNNLFPVRTVFLTN